MSKTLIRLTSSADDVVVDSPVLSQDEAEHNLARIATSLKANNFDFIASKTRVDFIAPQATLTFEIVEA